jgi:hypothetical protein
MQPAEARGTGGALDDRPAADLDVALKLATDGSKACNRKVEVRRNAAKAAGRT